MGNSSLFLKRKRRVLVSFHPRKQTQFITLPEMPLGVSQIALPGLDDAVKRSPLLWTLR